MRLRNHHSGAGRAAFYDVRLFGLAIARKMGLYERAAKHFLIALAPDEKKEGDFPALAAVIEDYAILLRKSNREAQALGLENRARGLRRKYLLHPVDKLS
ncbi:MAG TPA: hypothetical protein VKU00_03385 [Chthonomonadaceae bacterium]|nr:hypothetical protein [Chthonomonadaceae bacterium]